MTDARYFSTQKKGEIFGVKNLGGLSPIMDEGPSFLLIKLNSVTNKSSHRKTISLLVCRLIPGLVFHPFNGTME